MEMGTIQQAFEDAIAGMQVDSRDKAAVELARNLSSQMDVEDDSALLVKLADSYLRTLEALQMTPRARAIAQKGIPGNDKPAGSKLDELRDRRARKSGAASMDSTAS